MWYTYMVASSGAREEGSVQYARFRCRRRSARWVGRMQVLLMLLACARSVRAQCDDVTVAAETTCKSDNACTECSDFNFGDDCASNQREHCAEIECCPTCETEIRSMFACEHGATCGEGLTCGAPPSPPPADECTNPQQHSIRSWHGQLHCLRQCSRAFSGGERCYLGACGLGVLRWQSAVRAADFKTPL